MNLVNSLFQSFVTLVEGAGGTAFDALGSLYMGIGVIMIGMSMSSIAEGIVCYAALTGMARNPEATKNLRSSMILGVSLCESVAIYGLVLALLLIFVKSPVIPA